MQKIILVLMLSLTLGHTLTLSFIKNQITSNPLTDTLDVWIDVQVKVKGYTSAMSMHLLQKGKDKVRLEQEFPTGKQRIIQNGNKFLIVDLKTGNRHQPDASSMASNMVATPPSINNFLGDYQYHQPISLGADLYKVVASNLPDSNLKSRSFTYNSVLKSVTEIEEVNNRGDSTLTSLVYCNKCEFLFPTQTTIRTVVQGEITLVTLMFRNAIKPSSIPDNLFKID